MPLIRKEEGIAHGAHGKFPAEIGKLPTINVVPLQDPTYLSFSAVSTFCPGGPARGPAAASSTSSPAGRAKRSEARRTGKFIHGFYQAHHHSYLV